MVKGRIKFFYIFLNSIPFWFDETDEINAISLWKKQKKTASVLKQFFLKFLNRLLLIDDHLELFNY